MPYRVNNPGTRQIGQVEQQAPCPQPVTGPRNLAAEPSAQRRLQILKAQKLATGRDQMIAVIDSGVQPHPRLAGRLLNGGDYIENRSDLFDCDGHGTAVAGLIAAAPDLATGFVGVAPAARILAIRQASTFYSVLLHQQDGQDIRQSVGDTASMARAVMRAVQLKATVINISEAACFPAEPKQPNAPDLQAAVHYAVEHDVVVVVAAANTSSVCQQNSPEALTTISSPGWFDDDVLAVAATDGNGEPANFSLRGPWVDVAAPGTGAVSLAARQAGLTTGLVDVHSHAHPLDGTSFATPYVAGLAALVRDRYRNLTAREVMNRIKRTARHATGPAGHRQDVGYGMIDPVAALDTVLPEEHDATPQPVYHTPPPPQNTLPRTVALAGSGAALGLLGLTLVVVQTVTRHRRKQLGQPS
jgi:membrane-anchored mycosin MYCP